MYAIQSKPKNNSTADWSMCYSKGCSLFCSGDNCPCVYMFRGDAEIDMAGKIIRDDEHQYRIAPCELKYY